MVEITLPLVLQILQTVGILVGIVYYMTIMRNAQRTRELTLKAQEQAKETRQAQLLMELYETYRSPEFRKRTQTIGNLEYTDFDDFWEKYGVDANPDFWAEWFSVATFFNGIGVLVSRKLLDIDLVEELLSNITDRCWEMMGSIVLEWRKTIPTQKNRKYELLHGFEFLYNEMHSRGTI